jgi:hypothetical protein
VDLPAEARTYPMPAMNESQAAGRRLSRGTFFLKRLLPVILFGVLLLGVALPLVLGSVHPVGFPYAVLAVPAAMIVVFYFVFRRLIFDLADEVTDEGDALRVRFGADEERVPLAQIINVSYAGLTNPRRITLTLRHPGRFGRNITFSPQRRFVAPLSLTNPLVDELIERVDAARR